MASDTNLGNFVPALKYQAAYVQSAEMATTLSGKTLTTATLTSPTITTPTISTPVLSTAIKHSIVRLTAGTTLTASHPRVILANTNTGTFKITLPALSSDNDGLEYKIIKTNSGTLLTIGGTINGSVDYTTSGSVQYKSITLVQDNSVGSWYISNINL